MKKRIAAIISVIVITAVVLTLLSMLTMPKYQKGLIEGSLTEEYYNDTVPHEVLFIGDCETYENISTVELYEQYGISSYIRGNSQQLTWQAYYMLEDALRYETPKMVVFNVLALKYDEPQSETYNRMTLDGMRWSATKFNAIRASMLPDENMIEYVFPFLRFHARWSDLTKTDFEHMFSKDPVTINGYYLRADIRPQGELPDPKTLTNPTLGEVPMMYLQKMADLCRANGIEFVLIKAPIDSPYWYPEWDEQVCEFAIHNGLNYFNYVDLKDEIGLDMTTDTYDGGLHLNVYGAEKFADYMGPQLRNICELTDYRLDPTVASAWDSKIKLYNDILNQQLYELDTYGELQSFGVNAIE